MPQELYGKPLPGAQINRSHPLARGLVGCWLMNEQGNRCYDLSGHNNHGTLNSFTSPTYTLGQRSSNGIRFDGVDDYVDVGNDVSLNNLSEFTFVSWINKTKDLTNSRLFDKTSKLLFIPTGTNTFTGQVLYSGTTATSTTTTTFNNNISNFIVMTYSESLDRKVKIYINGVESSYSIQIASTLNLSPDSTASFYIGNRLGSDRGFGGSIDEVKIWNRALNASEIKQLYLNPYDIFNEN